VEDAVEGQVGISIPKPMGSSSRGSNCLTMARYSSMQATASMTAYFQPPSVKKICAQPDFAKISAILVKIAPISVPPYIKGVVCSRTPASPQAPRREPAAGLETRLMPRMTALPPQTVATAAEIAAIISAGNGAVVSLGRRGSGLGSGGRSSLGRGGLRRGRLAVLLIVDVVEDLAFQRDDEAQGHQHRENQCDAGQHNGTVTGFKGKKS